MDTDSFIVYIKTEDIYVDIYVDITKDVGTRFDTSNYELERPLPKFFGLTKNESGGEIRKEFAALRPKLFGYLTEVSDYNKKAKGTKKCVIK